MATAMTALPNSLLLHLHPTRPERARGDERAPWSDTVPACFRSEAFAEDLLEDSEPAVPQRRLSSLSVVPALGAALALTLGWMGGR